jgi:hypothetical protein
LTDGTEFEGEAAVEPGEEFTEAGDIVGFGRVVVPPLTPATSTPLDHDEPEGIIPPAPLWAMKDRRHYPGGRGTGDEERIRRALGYGDDTIYFIDDGRDHCMIGRRVGKAPEGLVYCLVGRIKLNDYTDIETGIASLDQVFSKAHDLELCGVFEEEGFPSDVIAVEHYRHLSDVPADYLPPSPFIEFTDPPEPS